TLVTSGPAAPAAQVAQALLPVSLFPTTSPNDTNPPQTSSTPQGRRLDTLRTPWGRRRFEWTAAGTLIQRSITDENKTWEVVQTADTITPGNVHFSMKSYRAKLMAKDGIVESQMPQDDTLLAHANDSITC